MDSILLDIEKIMSLIPHRYPFLLIDRITHYDLDKGQIIGIKNVTINEPQFMGHFPKKPIMPGVLIVEAMAQLSCTLSAHLVGDISDKEVFFMSISNAKFRKMVVPGDTMVLQSNIIHNRGNVWKFEANVCVDGQLVAEAQFSAMMQTKKGK